MKTGRHSEEQMVAAVKQMEAGRTAAEIGREIGVSKHTLYAWKAKYGGMEVNEAQRLKQLEDENRRLKQLVPDLSLDKEILKAVIQKNGWGGKPGTDGEPVGEKLCTQSAKMKCL